MAILHTIIFKAKDDVKQEQIDKVLKALGNLGKVIPNLSNFKCGKNFSDRSKGFTHSFQVEFPNKDALQVYQVHPEHVKVRDTMLKPIADDLMCIDYEF
ncbi:hypothetical protein U3516DRAFT_576887 [Neocallimastix sp. 'constans']|jgi:hypothetical protein